MLDQLLQQSEEISLEAISGGASVAQALARLPQFLDNAKTFYAKNFSDPIKTLFSKKDLAGFAQKVQPVSYVDLREVEIFVPSGLKTDLLSYSEVLLECAKYSETFRLEVLDPFAKWLSGKLAEPASLNSLRPALEIEGYTKRDLDKITKQLVGCFDEKSADGVAKYGKAIKRNADWTQLVKNSLELQGHFLKDDHSLIIQQVGKTTDLLDTLLTRIQQEPETYQVSGPVISSIAKTAYAVAREIEFYGIVRFRVEEYSHALNESTKKLQDVVRKLGH